MPLLAVNVDHVATIRQARLGSQPDPVFAASLAEAAGAAAIIVHLREDRRHILDRDVEILSRTVKTRLNLEMAATEEMRSIALANKPHSVCLVPEKRQELTTEGGLRLVGRERELSDYLAPLHAAGIRSSLFIDADGAQIEAAASIGSDAVELHTGRYADAKTEEERSAEFARIVEGIGLARRAGLQVNLGHGLDYVNILPFAKVSGVGEYSIGHSIISYAALMGLTEAVKRMVGIVAGFVD